MPRLVQGLEGGVIIEGDCREKLAELGAGSVRCCVTSPPYWNLRDYGVEGQIGLEDDPAGFVAELVSVFEQVRRVLADDGTVWLNLGDQYVSNAPGSIGDKSTINGRRSHIATRQAHRARRTHRAKGLKTKDLVGTPWMVALALQKTGWWLRQCIIWDKPNPNPESVQDRPTTSHEYVFLLSKSARYFYDIDAVRRPQKTLGKRHEGRSGYRDGHPSKGGVSKRTLHPKGGNLTSVWRIVPQQFADAHFAVMPEALVEPCILAGSEQGDLVLDPFAGTGTVGVVALKHGRKFVGIELNPEYADMARARIDQVVPSLFTPTGDVLK